jgi:hypothetical protein
VAAIEDEGRVRMRRRLLIWAGLTMMVTPVLSGTAMADPPTVAEFGGPFGFTIDCGTVTLVDQAFVSGWASDFAVQGQKTFATIHYQWDGAISNPVTGATVRDHGAWTERYVVDPSSGHTIKIAHGLIFANTIRGTGIVLQSTGTIEIDLDLGTVLFASDHAVAGIDQATALCPYLAP